MESMANSVEDYLISGLSFKLDPGASYVTDRRNVSFFTAGSNIYQSGSGARVIRIMLTGDGWLDPSTVRLAFTLVNNDNNVNHVLRPLSGGWSFFRRCRCLVGGAIVDDIDYYNRIHEQMHILTSTNNRDNDSLEGFGQRWDDYSTYAKWSTATVGGLAPGASQSVTFKPLFGLLNQNKYIPLSWCPLTMEFEVVSLSTDPIVSPSTATGATYFTPGNTSTSWQIQDVRIVCDVVSLDSGLQNSYAEHVLSGKALPINYGTYVSQYQTVSGGEFAVNITRAVSRLKTVFINFDNTHLTTNASEVVHGQFNTFTHPMAGPDFTGGVYNYNLEVQWQLQIGSKMIPEYPCRSLAETFYQLKKALGIAGSAFHSVDLTKAKYINDHYIIGVDCEKVLDASWTGLNTRAGDLMLVRVKGANGNLAQEWCNAIYMILHTDQILEVRDTGCQVFD